MTEMILTSFKQNDTVVIPQMCKIINTCITVSNCIILIIINLI